MASKKSLVLLSSLLLFAVAVSANHQGYYYQDGNSHSITGETGFSVPQFESQSELISELVVPFIFLSVLLQMILAKVLHFIVRDRDRYPNPYRNTRSTVRRQSMILSIAITAMLVPTPFWGLIRGAMASIGIAATLVFAAVVFFLFYIVVGAMREHA